jgi:hypothetical protein
LQFRVEAFNIFNRAQYGAPLADLSAGPGEFGFITQPVNTPPIGNGTPDSIRTAKGFLRPPVQCTATIMITTIAAPTSIQKTGPGSLIIATSL